MRSKGRRLLLQAMYAARLSGRDLGDCLEQMLDAGEGSAHPAVPEETAAFARELGRKVARHGADLEASIRPLLANWELERVGLLERLIIALALTELHHSPEVPYRVVLDEACELARTFCDEDAVKFVNGILDRAAADLKREVDLG
jgi:N utilization substance protein B